MDLFKIIKPHLSKEQRKSLIYGSDFIALGRRDFIGAEGSPVQAFSNIFNLPNLSFEYRSMLSFIEGISLSSKKIDLHILSKSLTHAGLFAFLKYYKHSNINIYAPQGTEKTFPTNPFSDSMLKLFNERIDTQYNFNTVGQDLNIIFCNSSQESDLITASVTFGKCKKAIMIIKGYSRSDKSFSFGTIVTSECHSSLPFIWVWMCIENLKLGVIH